MKQTEPSPLEDQLKQVHDFIAAAYVNYQIWRVYTEHRMKYLKVLRRYNSFFRASLQAHFAVTIIALYRLYETQPDTISFPILIRDVSDPNLRAHLDTMLDAARLWREKITILRNEVYAHPFDRNTIEKFAEEDVTLNKLASLIDISKQLLNAICHALHKRTFAFDIDPSDDTQALLDALSYRY